MHYGTNQIIGTGTGVGGGTQTDRYIFQVALSRSRRARTWVGQASRLVYQG